MVFLPNLSVNLRAFLCGVVNYASAQALDFLDLGQKSSFLDWKHKRCPSLATVFYGRALVKLFNEIWDHVLPAASGDVSAYSMETLLRPLRFERYIA